MKCQKAKDDVGGFLQLYMADTTTAINHYKMTDYRGTV